MRWAGVALVLVLACGLAGAAELPVKAEARELWKQSMNHHRAHDEGRALDAFLKAYQIDRAVLGLETGDLLDSLVDHVRSRLDSRKDDLAYTFKLAELLNMRGELDEAIRCYERVVKLNPQSPMAQIAADAARELHSFREADRKAAADRQKQAQPEPSPSASAAAPAKQGSGTAALAEAEERIAKLEESLKAQKEEFDKLTEEHTKLQEEHTKLQEEHKVASTYKTLFFANPANIENLRNRRLR